MTGRPATCRATVLLPLTMLAAVAKMTDDSAAVAEVAQRGLAHDTGVHYGLVTPRPAGADRASPSRRIPGRACYPRPGDPR